MAKDCYSISQQLLIVMHILYTCLHVWAAGQPVLQDYSLVISLLLCLIMIIVLLPVTCMVVATYTPLL